MNVSALIIPFQLLLTGCDDEPEYDLSKIPVAEQAPEHEENPTPPKGRDIPGGTSVGRRRSGYRQQ